IVDNAELVVADIGDKRRPVLSGLVFVAIKNGIPLLAFASIGNIEKGESLIFCGVDGVESLRVGFIFVNQFVLILTASHVMVEDFVIIVRRRHLLVFFRRIVPAVIETAALPGKSGNFHPLQNVGQ